MTDDVKPSESSTEEEVEEEAEEERAEGHEKSREEDAEEPGPVPYARFKEVNDALRAYKKHGDPETLAARLAKLGVLENMVDLEEDEEPPKPTTPEEKQEAERKKQAKELIAELYPEIKHLPGLLKELQGQRMALADEAWEVTLELMEEEGMEVDEQEAFAFGSLLKDQINATPTLRRKFNLGDVDGAVRGAYEKLKKRFSKGETKPDTRAEKLRGKKKLSELPKKTKSGGVPSTTKKGEDGPKDLDEAESSVMGKLDALFGS